MSKKIQFPLGHSVTLADLEGDVHPILHQLRRTEPVSWVPALNAWLITRRDLAIAVMRDAQAFTVDHPGFSTAQVVGTSMLSLDGDEHLRHRQPFELPFRRVRVQSRFRQPVIAMVQGLLNGFAADGQAELRRNFASPVAVRVMMMVLGLEGVAIRDVVQWYDTIVTAVTRVAAGEPVSEEGQMAFASLRAALWPALTCQPESSLLAMARGMGDGLSDEEIIANAAVLLFGGIETTEGMIANTLYYLLVNPTILRLVQGDLDLVTAVVEETLRLEPAAAVVDRYAVKAVQLGQAVIQPGDLVQVSLAAANRDPETFAEPDRFDLFRPNLQSHVTFAQGPHVCLGLHLARLEAQIAVAQLLPRLPNLHLMTTNAARLAAQPQGLIFRKPLALWVQWDKVTRGR